MSAVASAELEECEAMEEAVGPDELAVVVVEGPIGLAGVDVQMKVNEEGRG